MKSGNNAWLLTLRYPSCRQRSRRRRRHRRQRFNLLVWPAYYCWLGSWNCRSASASGLVCSVLFTSAETEMKFKQSKRAKQQQQQLQPSNDSQLRRWRRCLRHCWSFTNSTSRCRRRRRLSLSSFLQLCLLPTNTDIRINTDIHTLLHFMLACCYGCCCYSAACTHIFMLYSPCSLFRSLTTCSLSLPLCLLLPAVGSANVFAFGLFVATLWVLLQLPLLLCCLDM